MRVAKWILAIVNGIWIFIFFVIASITQYEVSQKFINGQCPANHPVGDFGCSNGLTVAGLIGISFILWFVTIVALIVLKIVKMNEKHQNN
ncbi:hypothetical protein [Culicoidibacter larvae]|uniref:Uncharacterized protein n=1 Tax=Culicoidibacter larvae TaxID=2579976 RepID=A0A5R8Q7C5_9FIRM|nr:hypothetical protein [Culicoidibacter larvae]TLG71233.1 hypothetical protein FEZ08_11300 [Culicoidibacter larvae]